MPLVEAPTNRHATWVARDRRSSDLPNRRLNSKLFKARVGFLIVQAGSRVKHLQIPLAYGQELQLIVAGLLYIVEDLDKDEPDDERKLAEGLLKRLVKLSASRSR